MNLHSNRSSFGLNSRKDILGISVASVARDEAIGMLERMLSERRFTKVSFLNAHNANIACDDAEFASALKDFLILPDGVGVDIAAKLLYGEPFPANLNGTDFIPGFLKASKQPLTVGSYRHHAGQRRGRGRKAFGTVRASIASLSFTTAFSPSRKNPKSSNASPGCARISSWWPWACPARNCGSAARSQTRHCTLPIAVGALLDFLSGAVPRAPLWMRRLRLEWVFRLLIEPRRLWRRYVVGNPLFLARVLRQKFFGRA